MNLHPASPLLVAYFDGSCGLCSAEMRDIASLDRHREIRFVDCSPEGFDDEACRSAGINRADLMRELHVQDVLGDWRRGVDAIALLYATAGAPWLARAWAHPLTRPFTRRLYPWVVAHRHQLSALGLHVVAPRVLRAFARRHGAPGAAPAQCTPDGACRTAGAPAHPTPFR